MGRKKFGIGLKDSKKPTDRISRASRIKNKEKIAKNVKFNISEI